jgi:PPOX class probable FMN-dependent enzyme
MSAVRTIEELEAIYGRPNLASTVKEIDYVSDHYRAYIEASPFVALATSGPDGLDCSPRGDAGACVRVADRRTLIVPDRRGNNRIDSLRNIVRDPRCALMFLIPGSANCLRVNGRAEVRTDPDLLQSFAVDGQSPRSAIVMTTEAVYFQCARAIIRAGLWNPARHVGDGVLPTPGEILEALSRGEVNGPTYDRDWPERARRSMW